MNTVRALLAVAIVGIVAYGVFETRFWKSAMGLSMISPHQRRIRGAGLILLFFGLCFWLRGTYIHIPHPVPGTHLRADREEALRYIGYWTFTFCLMLPLIPLAILDTRENFRRAAEERQKLLLESRQLQAEMNLAIDQVEGALERNEQAE